MQVVLFHEHACEALSDDAVLELCDWCCRKALALQRAAPPPASAAGETCQAAPALGLPSATQLCVGRMSSCCRPSQAASQHGHRQLCAIKFWQTCWPRGCTGADVAQQEAEEAQGRAAELDFSAGITSLTILRHVHHRARALRVTLLWGSGSSSPVWHMRLQAASGALVFPA